MGSLIRVICEYTSRGKSPSTSSSSAAVTGSGRSFSFWAFFVVRCGPTLDANEGLELALTGAPWLLRRRSLLFKADRPVVQCCWPAWEFWTGGEPVCNGLNVGSEAVASPYVLMVARGLNVTVRGGRFSRGDVFDEDSCWYWGRSGVVSCDEDMLKWMC